MRAPVIEDERKTAMYLLRGLTEHGFVVDATEDGDDGLMRASAADYDVIILDVMLSKRDGWSVLRDAEAREHNPCALSDRERCCSRSRERLGVRCG